MPQREYIDFKLYLTKAPGGEGFCQVSILPTPELGETSLPVVVPAEQAPEPDSLTSLAGKIISLSSLAELGKRLSNCLLPAGPIRDSFLAAYRQAGNEGGVRLRLIIANHRLKQLPWEYVFLKPLDEPDSMRGFLLLDPRISMVRHEPLLQAHPVIQPSENAVTDLRMVIAAASPAGSPQLNIADEVSNIQQAVQDFNVEGVRISITTLMDATPAELMQSLTAPGTAFILHFAGHGASEVKQDWFQGGVEKTEGSILLLADRQSRREARVSAEDLSRLLRRAGVRLALIGACHSGARDARYPWDGVAGALTAGGIAAVIAMQYEVYDQHMVDFSQMFYYALASGLTLDEAVGLGRQAMYSADAGSQQVSLEWGVPVFYSRLPTGVIFPERAARAGAAAENLRMLVNQTIGTIEESGEVTGIQIERVGSGDFQVNQRVEVVKGKSVGAVIGGATGPEEADRDDEEDEGIG